MSKKLTSVFKIDGEEVQDSSYVIGGLRVFVNTDDSAYNPSNTFYFVDMENEEVQFQLRVDAEGGPEGSCSQDYKIVSKNVLRK